MQGGRTAARCALRRGSARCTLLRGRAPNAGGAKLTTGGGKKTAPRAAAGYGRQEDCRAAALPLELLIGYTG